jgi:O-antigen biosynthesis protein
MSRVIADGKHLSLDGRPFRVRGVTYGGFRTRLDGHRYPERQMLKSDLVAIADAGLNTVRVYDLPPSELIDIAEEIGLRLIVGVDYHDWRMEPHVGRRAQRRILDAGRRAVSETMERCAGRPGVLAVAVGNEIPADLVRLHGIGRVEDILSALVGEVHSADPGMPATYVNYPTTEFLEVEGQDLACFNVFLEDPDALRRYLRHLQVAVGPRPLVITELGLAGAIHGEDLQAESLDRQLRVVDETGCAGASVFAWTDEWAVDDRPVEGWGFGITREDRSPKPAFPVVEGWARRSLRDLRDAWPRVSVVVCAYNEERTIAECLGSLAACEYPDLEVIMCDDGSTDRTLELARRFPFKVLELPHGGLSRARNAGLEAATGDIVAYLDADAACHLEWPFHLALSMEDDVVATGGPNLPVPGAGFVERAVGLSPGSPVEVLVADDRAEHVPGCNMAYRRTSLQEIGGFDPVYTAAGDDVDVCWRLLDLGHEIGFTAAAQVRHHRRGTVRGYFRQQRGYGRAEKMLSGPHRHRFNGIGQARWRGFIYGGARVLPSLLRPVVYHGYQGHAPFQTVQRRRAESTAAWMGALLPISLPAAIVATLLALASPWWLVVPALLALLAAGFAAAVATAMAVPRAEPRPWRLRALVAALHVAQPFVRAWGRLRARPVPEAAAAAAPWWGERSHWLDVLGRTLRQQGWQVRIGEPDSPWDLEASTGPLVRARLTAAVVWNWEPRATVRLRPSAWSAAAVTAAAGLALLEPFAGAIALTTIAALGVVEAATLRRKVQAALAESTRGAS